MAITLFLPLHLQLIFLFLVSSASSSNFTSIDCGASGSYKDKSGIEWETDKAYIVNGDSHVVENPDSVPEPLKTLRAFSSRKKNCYPIPVPTWRWTRSRAGVLLLRQLRQEEMAAILRAPVRCHQLDHGGDVPRQVGAARSHLRRVRGGDDEEGFRKFCSSALPRQQLDATVSMN
ncbi:hypothetical protein Cni_G21756 [Canna indica]|uniref:Malectin-like domain-containing protein n=1 Tax=Canna indica TaxID=4628 RepID=A0AAQ3KQ53_9LILI|nr:hypothetical protein Cni_G21756 [Canna indica]